MPRYWLGLSVLLLPSLTLADERVVTPRPVPATRPEMKRLLEEMKTRKLRIPLPELTEAQKAELGERADSYETRLRFHYLPAGEPSVFGAGGPRPTNPPAGATPPVRDFTRNADENMSLTYQFKTMLFWIVSRTNNCQYCLGHQEQKLSATGMLDDEIAALDADWGRFTPAEQAAFAYARKLTYEPHQLADADIETLRKHYSDLQILEMTMSVSWNNSINRWKEGAGIPQSHDGANFFRRAANIPADRPVPNESFLTPTSETFAKAVTKVAPLEIDLKTGQPTRMGISSRPVLESRAEVEAALSVARQRHARLPVLSEDAARQAFGEAAPSGRLPLWIRLMANFPRDAQSRLPALLAIEQDRGELSPLLKAQVSWIIARQDRAWYATEVVKSRLRELGQSDDQIYALDGKWDQFTPAERAQFRFARKLAATPIALTDEDVEEALQQTSPRQVVQLVNFVTSRAYFDRVTEAAGLPIDTP